MTRALLHARQHAETCNGLECAPPEPVDAPYLAAAIERCKLPIKIYVGMNGIFIVGVRGAGVGGYDGEEEFAADPAEATRAYFALVASLTEPAQASRAATAGVGPASTSASFSPSAPLVSPDPGAVAGEVPPIANASPASDSGAR